MNQKILAITGRAQSGKSTLATLLQDHHSYKVIDFADPLKEMIRTLLMVQGYSWDQAQERLYGNKKESPCPELSGRTPRHAMQTLGTEWRDLIDTNLWVNIWERRILLLPKIIVGDMRFPHELERVRKVGGRVVSVIRGEDTTFGELHQSERHFTAITAQADLVIINDMTPHDMLRQAESFFGDWL